MNDKVAFVTGGAQGIGKAYCRELLRNGAKVAFGDVNKIAGQKTVEELRQEFGNNVVFYVCDVTDSKQLKGCFEDTIKEFGGLDILINNAGICNESDNGWKKMIDINLVSVVEGTKLGLKYMNKSDGGRGGIIVNIASITALSAWECVPVYSSTKAAVNQLSRSYGTDLYYKGTGVKVVSINPGITDTDMLTSGRKTLSEDSQKSLEQVIPNFPIQNVDNMGKGLIHVIKTADNGSLWMIENEKPPYVLA